LPREERKETQSREKQKQKQKQKQRISFLLSHLFLASPSNLLNEIFKGVFALAHRFFDSLKAGEDIFVLRWWRSELNRQNYKNKKINVQTFKSCPAEGLLS